jgi:hypothetical protein
LQLLVSYLRAWMQKLLVEYYPSWSVCPYRFKSYIYQLDYSSGLHHHRHHN